MKTALSDRNRKPSPCSSGTVSISLSLPPGQRDSCVSFGSPQKSPYYSLTVRMLHHPHGSIHVRQRAKPENLMSSPASPITAHSTRPNERGTPVAEFKSGVVPSVLNLAEAATLVRCSRAHLCNVINGKVRGIPHLPTVRIGRRVLFRRESLEQWLREIEAAGV